MIPAFSVSVVNVHLSSVISKDLTNWCVDVGKDSIDENASRMPILNKILWVAWYLRHKLGLWSEQACILLPMCVVSCNAIVFVVVSGQIVFFVNYLCIFTGVCHEVKSTWNLTLVQKRRVQNRDFFFVNADKVFTAKLNIQSLVKSTISIQFLTICRVQVMNALSLVSINVVLVELHSEKLVYGVPFWQLVEVVYHPAS